MDANSRKLLGLMAEMNVRYQVPVYQRPYSWDEPHCTQLWEDILSAGRSEDALHFTGSIVTIQDGTLSDQGVAELLLIDGQQRITTVSLILVALARYAAAHPERVHAFSAEEILAGGYLTNHFRQGADHPKLTLSKTDREDWARLLACLATGEEAGIEPASRLAHNLALFQRRIDALDNVDAVWRGLQRLEVVGISLVQGRDDPQAIFESMNATGKDLTNADLVRNFVLMSYPLEEQQDLYRTYWQPIELTLASGTLGFDEAFDDYIRSYLGVVNAPTSMARVDVYQAFKRYVLFRGFNRHDRMKNLSLRLKRFARYYVAVTRAHTDDEVLARAFARIAHLDVPSVHPLLIWLYDAFEHQALAHTEFVQALETLESYLFRREVCDCAPSALASFFPSLVARLDAVRAEEGDVAQALCAMLLNEQDTPRRFPTDAEFAHALNVRDASTLSSALYLLARIDEQLEPSDTLVLERYNWTLEHVLPVRALEDKSWRAALGANPERAFEECVHNLGNLALTNLPFDLQEGSLADKQERLAQVPLVLAADVLAAKRWGPEEVRARAQRLTDAALAVWRRPQLAQDAGAAYRLSQRAAAERAVTFADLFAAKLVQMDDALVSVSPLHPGRATVTSTGKIMLANGEMFEDPTAAYERFLATQGGMSDGQSGWMYWRRGEGGPLLDDLRAELANS